MNNKRLQPYGPVTIIIRREVKPGFQKEFEAWLRGIGQDAQKSPGYQGVNIVKPADDNKLEYVNIFRFDSYENMRRWENSEIRKKWLSQLDRLLICESEAQVVTGMEYWFSLPERPLEQPPPRYKMAIVTWLAVYPLLLVLPPAFNLLFSWLAKPVVLILSSAVIVILMTYLVMPGMTRLFARWLFQKKMQS